MKMRRIRIALGMFILILVAILAWATFLPRHGRPNVSIQLVGYTNDSSGARLALITVTNLSSFTIYAYLPTIQVPAPAAPMGYSNYFQDGTNQWSRFHSRFDSGASGSFMIPYPTLHTAWRIRLNVYNDFGTVQLIKRFVSGRRMPFQIESDWIEAGK